MDESTLNDLLECSVCLDRLDTTSKVLPCQHTFCRKCLENIVSSHKALRCPECRILIDVKIDELPPNVLLMRILGGMKTATQPSVNESNTADPPKSLIDLSLPSEGQLPLPHLQHAHNSAVVSPVQLQPPMPTAHRQPHHPASHLILQPNNVQLLPTSAASSVKPPVTAVGVAPQARALFDYVSKDQGDISFKKGDLIHLRKRLDAHWFHGELNGIEGVFPVNYVQVVVPLPVPQCRALYDFRMGPNEEDGCLTFNKGAVITVLRRVDHNWAEGRIAECIGIFPIAFVEMNGMAQRMMEQAAAAAATAAAAASAVTSISSDIATAAAAMAAAPHRIVPPPQSTPQTAAALSASSELLFSSDSSSSTLTNSTNSSPSTSSSTSTSTPTSPVTSNVVIRQSLANKAANEHKRHSLTVLSGANSVAIAAQHHHHSNRHSVEILSAPDPPPDTPCEAPSAGQHSSTAKPAPQQRRSHPHPIESTSRTSSSSNHKESSGRTPRIVRSSVHHHHQGAAAAHPSLPANYIALFPYKPHKSDELELKKGAVYYVTERCQDGWFKGASRGNHSGVFPGNYVAPLRNNQRDRNQLLNLKQQANIMVQNASVAVGAGQPQASHPHQHGGSRSSPLHAQNGAAQPTQSGQRSHSGRSACIPPPELPPRSAAVPPTDSVWTKPLGQHVESFFSRKSSSGGGTTKTDSTKHKKDAPLAASSSSSSAATGTISLMKRLTNIKRSKSPTHNQTLPPSAYSMDNPVFEDATDGNAAAGAVPPKPQRNAQLVHPVHVRSGSCPSQLLQNLSLDGAVMSAFGSQRLKGYKERANLPGHPESQARLTPSRQPSSHSALFTPQHSAAGRANHGPPPTSTSNHRKSHSLDATTIASQMTHSPSNGLKYNKPSHAQNAPAAERFRCIVPYPPNGEFELELQLNDIVMVHKKRDNGWYKGAHARTGRIGLFPASFVEPDA